MSDPANFSSIPVVDISKLHNGTRAEQQQVADELGKAARNVGFVYITGGGIDEALFDGVLDAAKRFFALSHEEKMKVYIGNSKCHRGYVPGRRGGLRLGIKGQEGGLRSLHRSSGQRS